ncbi:hypothetical protein [Neorhizobium tomejilense]|uniref:hypothetical protein n=1 Tax=Neorhizobium tomejilense TaxID=2093828 RepID=UPI000CF89E37|nr:hypothetical protein [Neorhizobium tomejilense]
MDLITTYVSDEDLRRLNWHQQSPFPTDDSISISETISSTINPFTALNCALNQEITVALYLALVVDGNFETQISSFYEHEVKRSSYRHYSSGGRTATTALSLGRTPAPQMREVVDCDCMKAAQDETCPVGYPSLLCDNCDGTGVVTKHRAPVDSQPVDNGESGDR